MKNTREVNIIKSSILLRIGYALLLMSFSSHCCLHSKFHFSTFFNETQIPSVSKVKLFEFLRQKYSFEFKVGPYFAFLLKLNYRTFFGLWPFFTTTNLFLIEMMVVKLVLFDSGFISERVASTTTKHRSIYSSVRCH